MHKTKITFQKVPDNFAFMKKLRYFIVYAKKKFCSGTEMIRFCLCIRVSVRVSLRKSAMKQDLTDAV